MASFYVRKDSPFYYLRFRRPNGTWGSRSSHVKVGVPGSVRKIHQLVLEETAKEAECKSDWPDGLFNRWVPHWIGYRYTNLKSKKRCENAWAHLSSFFTEKGIVHPVEITYSVCHQYMKWRTSQPEDERSRRKATAWNTAVMEVRFLGAMMSESVKQGWVVSSPCSNLGLGKQTPKAKRAITRDEEEKIFKALKEREMKSWMSESFLVAMRQGCRQSEVEVPLDRIDTAAMVITFKVKGGAMHAAPLHKDLLPLVAKAKREGRDVLVPLPAQRSPRWYDFFMSIGLEDLCFHCTRVTVVTRLCEAGFSESQTMAYVGHASEMVHALYRKMRPSAVAKLGDAL